MKPIGGYTVEDRAPILRFKCPACGAKPRSSCTTRTGQDCIPHKARVLRAGQTRAHIQTDAAAVPTSAPT